MRLHVRKAKVVGFGPATIMLALMVLLTDCVGETGSLLAPERVEAQGFGSDADKVWMLTTDVTRAYDLTVSHIEAGDTTDFPPFILKVVGNREYQTIDGFGAAITGATAFNLMKMEKADREEFLKETFSVSDGFGMSYVRVPIGCSDFSLSEYTCCDTEGIENFTLTAEETEYIIPVLKEIALYNPSLKIIATPWTAPLWMKVDNLTDLRPCNSWTGGHLNPACYQDYAAYFVKWIRAFEAEGLPVYAITPQNEPLNYGNSASMYMGWEEQRDFIKSALGPAFREGGIGTKIYVFDHNYDYDNKEDQKGYPMKIYRDAEASRYVAGAAFHNYGGDVGELETVHTAFPEKELVFTEATAGDWNDGANLAARLIPDMERIALGTINRWARGAVVWNLMLDSNRGPNRPGGCTRGFGAVDLADDNKTIRRNSYYYIMAHMAWGTAPGAIRVGTTGYSQTGLTYCAFRNPDRSFALVLSNGTEGDLRLTVDDGVRRFPVTIPGKAIVTLKWRD